MERIKGGAPFKSIYSKNESVRLEGDRAVGLVMGEEKGKYHLLSYGKDDKKITTLETFDTVKVVLPESLHE